MNDRTEEPFRAEWAIAWITVGKYRPERGDAYVTPWPPTFDNDAPPLQARILAGPYPTREQAVDRYLNGPSIGRIT